MTFKNMTSLLLLSIVVLLPAPSWAVMAKIGSQGACVDGNLFAGTTSYVYTYPAALTSGSLAIVAVGIEEDKSVSTISGTGASYALSGVQAVNGAAGYRTSQWYAVTSSAGTTVTVTLGAATTTTSFVCFLELSGNESDQSTATTNTASPNAVTAHGSGSVTPPSAENTVVASMNRTPTSGPGWTEDGAFTMLSGADARYAFGYLIQSAATAQSFDATSVDNEYSAMNITAFLGTGGGSAPNFFPRRLQVNP